MAINLSTLTIHENHIHITATDKNLREYEFMFAHSIIDKNILNDTFEAKQFFQQKINSNVR